MHAYALGTIAPPSGRGIQRAVGYEFYRLVPPDVLSFTIGLGDFEYTTTEGVDAALAELPRCRDALAAEGVDRINLGGAPIAALVGRARMLRILDELEQATGIPATGSLEAPIEAMHALGLQTLAIASRWSTAVNDAIAEYFSHAGITVIGSTQRGQRVADASAMTLARGAELAAEVGLEAVRAFPAADAVILPGSLAPTLHVIPLIEEASDAVALTPMTTQVWTALVRPGVIAPVPDRGRLMATPGAAAVGVGAREEMSR